MDVYKEYAQFYDALYQEKDYNAECEHLEQVFARHTRFPVNSILDLGCGTGGHALPLAQRGYLVTGVDRSEQMLDIARQKALSANLVGASPIFYVGDIRDLHLDRNFDAVISMFAVVSYLVSNEDLLSAFQSARRHLKTGGLYYFDAWFGPAVLSQRPADRYKVVDLGQDRIIRFVHPEMDLLRHRVDVYYKVLKIREKEVLNEVDEVHSMRFLFTQEVQMYLSMAGFRVACFCPFMRLDDELSERDWSIAVVAEAD